MYQKHPWDNEMLQPTSGAMLDFLPPSAYPHTPATSFATKFVHVSTNKIRTGINCVLFTPDGRRYVWGYDCLRIQEESLLVHRMNSNR